MIYIHLFLGFLKVGCFAFGGGYGSIPLIREIVLSNQWLTDEALTYMIAVSESTPGPIMVNLATYIGSSQAGFFGALLATAAVVAPAFLIILFILTLLKAWLQNKYVQAALQGVQACVIGMILATGLFMIGKQFDFSEIEQMTVVKNIGMTAALFGIMELYRHWKKKKLSPIIVIIIAACLGGIVYC